ncbi:MAG TPA: proton-conducting transporter membrane subunit [Pelolinea sp.]|nr:proton-conducting transporter membrane subunit [Pelolinea sp.]
MNAPLIWIIFPLGLSLLLLILRKNYFLSCLIQAGASFILVSLAIFSSLDTVSSSASQIIEVNPVFNFLGRSLVIDKSVKTMIIIFYSFLGAWTSSLYFFKIKSKIVPLGLAFIALLLSTLSVEPFLYSALILEIAVIISVIMVTDSSALSNKGALRYLIYFTIGMPFVLLAGWYLAGGEITPVNEEQLIQATLLLGLGFVFWLGVFPFQSWIPLIAEENRSTESLFLLILMPVSVVVLLLKYLNGFVWLREYLIVYQALRLFGLIMVVTGAVWAFFQKNFNRMIGYLLIVSTGMMLLSVSIKTTSGFILSSYFIFSRLSSFFVLSWLLFLLTREYENMDISSLQSLFLKSPFAGFAILLSMFSISGMPFTSGFPAMQAFYANFSAESTIMNFGVIISIGIISILFLRINFLVLSRFNDTKTISITQSEKAFLMLLILLLLLSGLIPNVFFPGFAGIVNGYEFLVK